MIIDYLDPKHQRPASLADIANALEAVLPALLEAIGQKAATEEFIRILNVNLRKRLDRYLDPPRDQRSEKAYSDLAGILGEAFRRSGP